MTRKVYETDSDRKREEEVVNIIKEAWGCLVSKPLPHRYVVDRSISINNELKCWIEIKNISNKKYDFDEFHIASHKIINGITKARSTNSKFFLFVRWDCLNNLNDVHYIECCDKLFKTVKWGGRIKTARDNQDEELMVCIPHKNFKLLKRPSKL